MTHFATTTKGGAVRLNSSGPTFCSVAFVAFVWEAQLMLADNGLADAMSDSRGTSHAADTARVRASNVAASGAVAEQRLKL
jgi:hypothetical protein